MTGAFALTLFGAAFGGETHGIRDLRLKMAVEAKYLQLTE